MTRILLLLVIIATLGLTACDKNKIYKQYETVPDYEWSRDHVVSFEVPIEDTTANYDVYLAIRHTSSYPFANILINVTSYDPDENIRTRDFEFFLRERNGEFKAKGDGDLWDIEFKIYEDISYPKPGTYKYEVSNYMPLPITQGIMEIGLIVKNTEFEEPEDEE